MKEKTKCICGKGDLKKALERENKKLKKVFSKITGKEWDAICKAKKDTMTSYAFKQMIVRKIREKK